MKTTIQLILLLLIASLPLSAKEVSNQELLDLIQKQQRQINELMKLVKNNRDKVEQTDVKVEATVTAIESTLEQAPNKRTSVGGYGEIHYNNIEGSEAIDFHRFVLFFDHEFTDDIRFFSELELEHAFSGGDAPGEVELEQAYVEMDLTDNSLLRAGVFLVPVGIVNETHEPPTFYGIERNPVEKNIIPATWWEAGVDYQTQLAEGWTLDVSAHSGLNVATTGSKSFLIRSGRQKVAEAKADNLAYTGRIKYTAIPGLELSATYQIQDDITQGELGTSARLFSAHAIYNKDNFGVKALFASWNIDGQAAELIGRDIQQGYFIEPSYMLNQQWGLFARYSAWDNEAGLSSSDSEKKQTNFGISYWPHENVVFKLDIESRFGAQTGDGFNLGLGYMF